MLPSNGDIRYYEDNKHLLSTIPSKSTELQHRTCSYPGLVNLGSTCYLNSLLQVLFHDNSFLRSVVHVTKGSTIIDEIDTSSNGDATTVNGNQKLEGISPIIHELRHLFLRLLFSNKSAVDTEQLLLSFGWTKSQFYEQHDVHEFFSVLLDILCGESKPLSDSIHSIFVGKVDDVLLCTCCSFTSTRCNPFNSISIDIPIDASIDQSDRVRHNLQDLISNHLQHEVLDDDNKWRCEQCNRPVAANKFVQYQSLPPTLVLHLKRFRFDPITRRRKKLNASIFFPSSLSSTQLMPHRPSPSDESDPTGDYELVGVVIHSGTAMGGHYYAYIKPDISNDQHSSSTEVCDGLRNWYSFNDSNVQVLSSTESLALLHSDATTPTTNDTTTISDTRSSFIRENAYLLVYRLKPAAKDAPLVVPIASDKASIYDSLPAEWKAELEAENTAHATLCRLSAIRRSVVEVAVFIPLAAMSVGVGADSHLLMVTALRTSTLREVLLRAHQLATSKLLFPAHEFLVGNCRLRRCVYDVGSGRITRLAETFGDNMDTMTMEAFACKPPISFLLERRLDSDPLFEEHFSDDMFIQLSVWPPSLPLLDPPAVLVSATDEPVPVQGRVQATVRDLRTAISRRLSLACDRFNMIFDDGQSLVHLLDASQDDRLLTEGRLIYPGCSIVVEVLPSGVTPAVTADESYAVLAMRKQKSCVVLHFNNPFRVDDAMGNEPSEVDTEIDAINSSSLFASSPSYDLSIEVSLDQSLKEVMAMIASMLGIGDDRPFHCRRNASGPQLKDLDKSLRDLALVDHGVLHLQEGPGCRPGEHLLRFELLVDPVGISLPTVNQPGADNDPATTATDLDDVDPLTVGLLVDDDGPSNRDVKTTKAITPAKQSVHLLDLPVSEKMTVNQVKQLLFERMTRDADMLQSLTMVPPQSPLCIRLRDGKGAKMSAPLRDDRLIGRCLLGLADGRRVVVQVLRSEERIGADDVIVSVRLVSYCKRLVYPSIDVPIARNSSIPDLFKHVLSELTELKMISDTSSTGPTTATSIGDSVVNPSGDPALYTDIIPALRLISIAKGYSTGPPLTLKSSLKLKWDDPAVLAAAVINAGRGSRDDTTTDSPVDSQGDGAARGVTVDQLPLTLRDGSVIVVRSRADYELYSISNSAVHAAVDGQEDRALLSSAGGNGLRAVRFKKELRAGAKRSVTVVSKPSAIDSSSSSKSSSSGKERALKILGSGKREESTQGVDDTPLPDSRSVESLREHQ